MSDIRIFWDTNNGIGDWSVTDTNGLESGNDLESAVFISLLTDRLCLPDDVIPDGTQNRRGWHGDTGELFPIGSRLWLLDRSKIIQSTLVSARDYIIEAIQWLVSDGIVDTFDIICEWIRQGNRRFLGAKIIAYKPRGDNQILQYQWAWGTIQ